MKKQLLSLKQKEQRKIKDFWRKDGMDFIARLGKLDKAIVVTYFTPEFPSTKNGYYAIGHRSFLPFTDKEHKTKFKDPIDCIEFSESIVLDWVQSLFVNDKSKKQFPLPTEVIDKW